jgi:hypothetical protein
MGHDASTHIRLSPELLKQAEELVPMLQSDPRYRSMPRIGRATVLRLAIDMGLHALRVHLATAPMLADDALGSSLDLEDGAE